MHRTRGITVVLTCCLLLLLAIDTASAEPFRVVAERNEYILKEDATFTYTSEGEYEVLSEQGIAAVNPMTLSFSESLQKLEVLEAATVKAKGERIDVPPENVQERAALAGGGPMFSDIKARTIIFPNVSVGDRVRLKVRYTQLQPVFPGHFSMANIFPRTVVREETQVILSVPLAGPRIRVETRDIEAVEPTSADGMKTWTWTVRNPVPELPGTDMLAPFDHAPRILASSFSSYGEIAKAYEERAAPKSRVTPAVSKLSAEITRGRKTQRDKAEALYYWVARNIRFAGNCLGMGIVVPHDVDTVLTNKLGDCKDHTALLQALLEAAGIRSTPALINSGMSFELPEVATPTPFNHVINYIPSLDIYADATAKYLRFGDLPITQSSKSVLHTASFEQVLQTPSVSPEAISSRVSMRVRVAADGSAEGEVEVEERGPFAASSRAGLDALPPNMRDRFVGKLLSGIGLNGAGEIAFGDPWAAPEPYRISLKFRIDGMLRLPGPGALAIATPLTPNVPIAAWAGAAIISPDPTLPYLCTGGTAVEEYRYEFPNDVEIIALPREVSIDRLGTKYESTYRQQGQVVTVRRVVSENRPSELCQPDRFAEYKPVAQEILTDLRAQLLYR